MADVFISYKSERRAAARHLQKVLRLYGYSSWYDYGLIPGDDFEPHLMAELNAAKVVVVLWCGLAVHSTWVIKEATDARALGRYLPTWIQDAPLPKGFEGADTINLTGWDGAPRSEKLDRLLADIGRRVGRDPAPDFHGLRELHEDWVGFGRPTLAQFGLSEAPRARQEPSPLDQAVKPARPSESEIAAAEEKARREAVERSKREAEAERQAIAERQRQAATEAARKAEEERLAKPRRAAEAARAGRPVVERAFPIELPGVAGWPTPQMIMIPPGRFLMGAPAGEERSGDAERPQHEVRIDYALALGQHAVTFADWDAALAAGAKLEKPGDAGWGRERRPVINVNWEDAQAYLAWLNNKAGLTGRTDAYRLPSEAEWEYACRAGMATPFSFGATISTAQANYDGNHAYGAGKKGEYRQKTTPVGSFPANANGLHEMHGNVWEWCQDCWNANYNGAPSDGSAWTTGDCSSRVLRGGSWDYNPQYLRSAYRNWNSSTDRYILVGFRLARTLFTP